MPIYEYRCGKCRRLSSVFVRSARAQVTPACEHCGSSEAMARVISRVARTRSTADVVGEHGTGNPGEYRDPRQIGSWVEQRFEEYGMDVPEETRAMIDAAREGELPKELGL
jgi:putative FmdB family regulatory protein